MSLRSLFCLFLSGRFTQVLLYILMLSFADFFQNYRFQKILSGTLSECQKVWIHIKTDIDPDLGPNCLQILLTDGKKLPLEN